MNNEIILNFYAHAFVHYDVKYIRSVFKMKNFKSKIPAYSGIKTTEFDDVLI